MHFLEYVCEVFYLPNQHHVYVDYQVLDDTEDVHNLNLLTIFQEIFVSDGAKSDLGNILDIFSKDNVVLIPDPVYPVYVDTNVMDGRKVLFMDANEENGFLPLPDKKVKADFILVPILSS